jgi:hypothetical protein
LKMKALCSFKMSSSNGKESWILCYKHDKNSELVRLRK